MLGALPFIAAIIAYIVLNEKISKTTLIAIIIAAAGIIFMCFDSIQTGTLFGLVNGLISSLGFAIFTVTLRYKKYSQTNNCIYSRIICSRCFFVSFNF